MWCLCALVKRCDVERDPPQIESHAVANRTLNGRQTEATGYGGAVAVVGCG